MKKENIIIIVLLLIITLGIGCFIGVEYSKKNNRNNSLNNINIEDDTENDNANIVSQEQELKDDLIINDVNFARNIVKKHLITCANSESIYDKKEYKVDYNDLTSEYYSIVSSYVYGLYDDYDEKNKDIAYLKSINEDFGHTDDEILAGTRHIKANIIDEKFKNIFGVNLDMKKSKSFGYPPCFYNKGTNNFIISYLMVDGICGPENINLEISDSIKYTIKDNNVYVYVNVIFGKIDVDGIELTFYNDREYKKENKTVKLVNDSVYDGIEEADYNDASQFKYTFERNENGTYKFVQMEQVK